jgi:hypothetical protein
MLNNSNNIKNKTSQTIIKKKIFLTIFFYGQELLILSERIKQMCKKKLLSNIEINIAF